MKQSLKIKDMAFIAMSTAILAVLAQISIPLPSGVPLTLQTFAVALLGYLLGVRRGLAAVGLYLLLGAIGVPVFASFHGGAGMLVGVTGGFLFGFFFLAGFCGLVGERNKGLAALLSLGGLLLCHFLGVSWFALISNTGWAASFVLVSLPYLVKDVLSLVAAYLLVLAIKRRADIFSFEH